MHARLGRYELLRRIARGGMAEVYLARRMGASSVEKRLVLKRILPERARDPRFVDLFVAEARLSMSLAHANIVPVFDFGRVDDELFLVMEHVPGADLGALLARGAAIGRSLDPVLVAAIGAAACEGLDYAHRRTDAAGRPLGIVHRDVTPRNLLISRAGEVKLVDFGVASLGAAGATGRVRGTPAYMAPEQARGEAVDARSDLYGLGLVLHEALSGKKARPGDAAAALAAAARGDVPPLPDEVPAELAAILRRSLAPSPDDRYPDGAEMGRALDSFVVAARAARPDAPPARQLAAWLAALFPDGDDAGRSGSLAAAVDTPGDATVRSVAETLAEAAEVAPPPPPPAKAPRRAWWIGGALAAAAAVAAWSWWPRGAAPVVVVAAVVDAPPPAAPDASPPDAPPPANAAPPPDATPRAAAPRRYPLIINSKPWARVYVDGKYLDDTPLETTLPAGRHRVRLENPLDGTHKEVVVDIPRDRRVLETLP